MRNLVIGAGGLLGSAFVRELCARGERVLTTGFGENYNYYFELTWPEEIYALMVKLKPQRVFMCAYNAYVDASEWDENAFQVNVSGNLHVALAADRIGAKVYFPSSSYVFDGKKALPYVELDRPNPINKYGEHKLLLERLIQENCVEPVIFRTVGLFGPDEARKNFVYQVADRIRAGEKVEAPVDQIMNPIHVDNLVNAVLDLPADFSGLVHIAGDRIYSKWRWACEIAVKLDWMDSVVRATKTGESWDKYDSQKAKRPRNGSLDCSKLVELIGYQPKWGLEEFLNGVYFSGSSSK